MSSTLAGHVRYKDQLKLERASTATAWMIATFSWIIGALVARPTPPPLRDEDAGAQQRNHGALY